MTEFDFEEEFDESQNGKTNLALDEYISIFTDFLEAVYKKK